MQYNLLNQKLHLRIQPNPKYAKYNATKFLKTIWHYFLIYTAISFGGMALPTIIGHEPFILLTFLLVSFI